jgi:hypothetical protein
MRGVDTVRKAGATATTVAELRVMQDGCFQTPAQLTPCDNYTSR